MRRICLCLLVVLACADVTAREVKLSSADGGGSCPTEPATPLRVETRKPTAVRDTTASHETRVRPSVHGDAGNAPRLRWHSFLPGMFR